VRVACSYADAEELSLSKDENFLTGELSFEKYKNAFYSRGCCILLFKRRLPRKKKVFIWGR
jgi:hypothetical protein